MLNLTTQSANKVNIVGKLVRCEIREGLTKNGKPYASARAIVRVNQSYLGRTEESDIPVSIFASKFTSTGANSTSYDNLMTLKDYKSIETHGVMEADTVRFTDRSTTLRENSYASKTGTIVDSWQIDGRYINKAKEGASHAAAYRLTGVVTDMQEEVDSEGETTGRMKVKLAIVKYGEAIDILEFVIEDPDGVSAFQRNVDINSTIDMWGRVRVSTQEVKKPVVASTWGEAAPEETTTRTARELIVTGYELIDDEDFQYDISEIKKAFNQRKANREQMLADASKPKVAPAKKQYGWE